MTVVHSGYDGLRFTVQTDITPAFREALQSAWANPETRSEVRAKLSRLIRSRWFEPPFGGLGFARLLSEALGAKAKGGKGPSEDFSRPDFDDEIPF